MKKCNLFSYSLYGDALGWGDSCERHRSKSNHRSIAHLCELKHLSHLLYSMLI